MSFILSISRFFLGFFSKNPKALSNGPVLTPVRPVGRMEPLRPSTPAALPPRGAEPTWSPMPLDREVGPTSLPEDIDEITYEEEVPVLPISLDHKRVIQSVLSVFETGSPHGDYGAVTVLRDGAGISYGKHQSTDKSGSLDAIVYRYIDLGGKYANDIQPFLPQLDANESALVDPKNLPSWVKGFMGILTNAGRTDPVMQDAQDQIFDEQYWSPAVDQAMAMKLKLPLSWLVVYDSTIHSGRGGVAKIRKLFPQSPPSNGGDEKEWTKAYLQARRRWLASSSVPIVQKTVYRIDSMLRLAEEQNWGLQTPFTLQQPRVRIS